MVARLVALNVGLPIDVPWHGASVHTGIWKRPVDGRRLVRRLNIEGDGQGDLAGHGGVHRAVLVYQVDSYRHWAEHLGRADLTYGQFGENFTVDGSAPLVVSDRGLPHLRDRPRLRPGGVRARADRRAGSRQRPRLLRQAEHRARRRPLSRVITEVRARRVGG